MFDHEGYAVRLARLSAEAVQRQRLEKMSLEEKLTQWAVGLSQVERTEGYSMDFFLNHFGSTPAQLGPALYSLGWRRRRQWVTGKPHHRLWVPPCW